MRTSFRIKLLSIVATAAVALIVIATVGALVSQRVRGQVGDIEQQYVPLLELGPRLRAQFDALARTLQDAVAASDLETLEATGDMRDRFLAELARAGDAIEPRDAAALRAVLEDYRLTATALARRLIAGETGEPIVAAISVMQAKQVQARRLLDHITAFDRMVLSAAFDRVENDVITGGYIRLAVTLVCLVAVLALSVWLARGVLRSVMGLRAGLERFGRGDFDEPIPVTSSDEIGDVAARANRMAESLARLSAERDRREWLKAGEAGLSQTLQGELEPEEVPVRALAFLRETLGLERGALREVRDDDAGPREPVFTDGRAVVPLVHGTRVTGVLELERDRAFAEHERELLLSVRPTLAISLEVARSRFETRTLLAETVRQARRLAAQEEELRSANEELTSQQEELRQANEELRQQTEELEAQRRRLSTVSSYKSQFLANMSHELRTPLNSMLLLSNLLAENKGQHLTEKQVDWAKTIYGAGKELLHLINQVLDLAKIEAGKQEIRIGDARVRDLAVRTRRIFEPLARDKALGFEVIVEDDVPDTIPTDAARVEQILNNLVGNAIKFTAQGEVRLHVLRAGPRLALEVSDTGIGIARNKQESIFAPFEQVESATDRRFGGTGLGLTIARELAGLLGGELTLASEPGKGSVFTLFLPIEVAAPAAASVRPVSFSTPPVAPRAAGGLLLVVEDDPVFAEVVAEVVESQGLDRAVARDAETGLRLARELRPTGIILDVSLPDSDGWKLMEKLRADPLTAAIPVHFVSALEGAERGAALGAVGYLTKPVTRRDLVGVVESLTGMKVEDAGRVLVIEPDGDAGESLGRQLADEDVPALRVAGAEAALAALAGERFGCIVVDLGLPAMNGLGLLQEIKARHDAEMPPIVVHTARALSREETRQIEAYAEAIILREGPFRERLLSEIRLFARRLKEGAAPRRPPPAAPGVRLVGRRVLVVDDDSRTAHALAATLRAKGVEVHVADTGKAALETLDREPGIDAVLMDVMMPEMDGYEAMRRIRQDGRFAALPVIALTARAMKGEAERCLQAGASDYLTKPVDADRLVYALQARLAADG
jgi:CheY-like chemotaxis protein/signal transduction histidine kinase/HAMP domain-containing protein